MLRPRLRFRCGRGSTGTARARGKSLIYRSVHGSRGGAGGLPGAGPPLPLPEPVEGRLKCGGTGQLPRWAQRSPGCLIRTAADRRRSCGRQQLDGRTGGIRVDIIEMAIGPGDGPETCKVDVVQSQAGEASVVVRLDAASLLARRAQLQQSVLASAARHRGILPGAERPLRETGQALFTALLGTGEVAGLYRASAAMAAKQEQGLRIVLRIGTPALAALPWEAMYDAASGDLRMQARSAGSPGSGGRRRCLPLPVRPPLRILGVVSAPRGLPALDTGKEQDQLTRALAPLARAGLAEVHWAPAATWAALHNMLLGGNWHVVHFIGHGGLDPVADRVLALTREDGHADLVSARPLVDLLRQARPMPRLRGPQLLFRRGGHRPRPVRRNRRRARPGRCHRRGRHAVRHHRPRGRRVHAGLLRSDRTRARRR